MAGIGGVSLLLDLSQVQSDGRSAQIAITITGSAMVNQISDA